MRFLITGGAGFIGSHLAERLLDRGEKCCLLDNLSTGSMENIRHLKTLDRMQYYLDHIENRQLVAELVDDADVVIHLAAAVGVKLIVESPVRTIETNVNGTQMVLEAAYKKRKLVFTASTSEVYGKNINVPFHEDADLVLGPTTKGRWSYAASKALDEFLALSYWKEKRSAGDRRPLVQHRRAAADRPLRNGAAEFRQARPSTALRCTVYGDGKQSRCFCDVRDTVEAILRLIDTDRAVGEVVNIGNDEEVTIEGLADVNQFADPKLVDMTYIPYDKAYEPGFEDMLRRVPSLEKLERLASFRPKTTFRKSSIGLPSILNPKKNREFVRMRPQAVTAAD